MSKSDKFRSPSSKRRKEKAIEYRLDSIGPAITYNWPKGVSTYDVPRGQLFPANHVIISPANIVINTDGSVANAIVQPLQIIVMREQAKGVPVALHFEEPLDDVSLASHFDRSSIKMLCLGTLDETLLRSWVREMTTAMQIMSALPGAN